MEIFGSRKVRTKVFSNTRNLNYCFSLRVRVSSVGHDLFLLTTGRLFHPNCFLLFSMFFSASVSSSINVFVCPLLCSTYEGPKPNQKTVTFYLPTVCRAFGISATDGVANHSLLSEQNIVAEFLCFIYLLCFWNMLYLKNQSRLVLFSIWKK